MKKKYLPRLNLAQKAVSIIVLGLIFAGYLKYRHQPSPTQLVELYSSLNKNEINQVRAILDQHKIMYKISSDEKSVFVTEDSAIEYRLHISKLKLE